ncbi:uncharacterized protein [Nicotiana tomentosiformis]|uniref:uncharacterized protein n=1 Tax=Nicotiana tomentosiformis TaxID=4098 RepID=UPI00388C65D1
MLAGRAYYCFLDGYSGYNHILIAPEDQEKTTFTCPYGIFAFSRIPFGLCNAPTTFHRCMMAIFTDMVEGFLEVFMDDFSVVGNSFKEFLDNWDKVLARCEETNLVLNWEKCHFMVEEGIVLDHKISKNEIQDRKGIENQVADHLSLLEEERPHDVLEINDSFPDEQLLSISMTGMPWKKLKRDCLDYYWDEPYLFKICTDDVMRRCVPEEEQLGILEACHSSLYSGHHGGARTTTKVLSCGFYWPSLYKNASDLVKHCDECQRAGGISKKNEMPLTTILEIDIFDVWGIDFMGPFMSSCGNTYILVAVDYVSKWVEVVALPNNEARSVVAFLKKNIFTKFGTSMGISDGGSDFCNKVFDTLLSKYDWSKKLDDALWAYRTAYKTPIAANLRVEQLNELDEFRFHAYSSSSLYKDKMKYLHDKYIWNKEFKEDDLVLLFNYRLRMFPGKLKSKWSGPFEVVHVTPFGALDLKNKNDEVFRVNGHRFKYYLGKVDDGHVVALLQFKQWFAHVVQEIHRKGGKNPPEAEVKFPGRFHLVDESSSSASSSDGSEEGSQASEPSSSHALADLINMDNDDVPDDGRGEDTTVGGLGRSKKPEIWEDRFVSATTFAKFREWWPQRSLTLERQFLMKDLDKHNPQCPPTIPGVKMLEMVHPPHYGCQ